MSIEFRRWDVLRAVVVVHGALLGCSAAATASGKATTEGSPVTSTPNLPSPDSVPVAFRVIPGARSQTSAHNEPARVVIRDTAAWERYWGRIVAQVAPTPPVPLVDFARQFVVAASMGQRSSGGYTIDVTAVYARGGTVHVVVKSVSPGRTCGAAMVMTAPVVAVAIDRVEGEVRFIETSETTECG